MNRLIPYLRSMGILLLTSGIAFAIQDPAPDPSNGSGWTVQAGEIDGIQFQNAASAPGNPAGTYYWIMASDSQSNPSYASGLIFQVTPGKTQPSGAPGISGGLGNTELLTSNTINETLANHTYHVYAQACPNNVLANGPGCSNWILINSNPVTTSALPPAPILGLVTADVTTNSETLHTDSSSVPDPSNVQFWNVGLNNLQSGSSQVFAPAQRSYSSATQLVKVGPGGGYNFTLLPNNRYQSVSQVDYFWSQPTAVPAQIENFTTTPVQPGPATVPNGTVTHCSAQIIVQNSNGLPANPTYTNYEVCLANGAGCAPAQAIGGSAQPTDSVTFTFSNLTSGASYGGGGIGNDYSQALNEDSAWSNSQKNTIPLFTTILWGGTFTVPSANVGTTTADFVAAGVNTAGVQTWQIQTTPPVAGLPSGTAADLNGTHTMTGLTPNTPYQVQIKITEASGCFSVLPASPVGFTTDPTVPTPTTFTAPTARSLNLTWGANGNPSPATTYQIDYSVDNTFASGVHTVTTTNASITITDSGATPVSPETTYFARIRAQNVSRPTWPDSAFASFPGSATTPNEGPTIVSGPTVTVFTTSATLVVTATDNAGPGPLVFNWTVNPGAGSPTLVSAAGTSVISGPNVTNTAVLNFAASNPFSGDVTVTDHGGVGGLSISAPWSTTGATLVPSTVDPIAPNPGTVVVGSPATPFSATIRDQFGNPMTSGLAGVTWSLDNGAASNTPVSASSFTRVTGVDSSINGGNATLTVRLGNGLTQTAAITVKPAGILFTGPNNPSVTLIPNAAGVTSASLHCLATDNNINFGTLHYSWTMETGPSPVSAIAATADATVTFSAAGTYSFRCNVADDLPNSSNSAVTNSTTVVQVSNTISVSPNNVTLQTLQNQVFTAATFDQFHLSMPTPPGLVWSTVGGGNVSGAGAQASFSSSVIGEQITVSAKDPATNAHGAAVVSIISFDVSNAVAFPVPYKATFGNGGVIHFKNLGTQWGLRIYTGSGRRVFDHTGTTDTYDWPIKNTSGENIASGVYFYVIESPNGKKDGKLIIIQ